MTVAAGGGSVDTPRNVDASSPRHAMARLVAAMMVANRRIAAGEIDHVARLDHVGLGTLGPLVLDELERAKRMPIDVERTCEVLSGTDPALIRRVLSALAEVAASDGSIDDDERRVFTAIATALGTRVLGVEDHLEGALPSFRSAAAPRRAVSDDGHADVLGALGLRAPAMRAEIDAAYLRLVDQYDPVRVAPLGADFVVLVIRKLGAVTDAYEAARRHLAKG